MSLALGAPASASAGLITSFSEGTLVKNTTQFPGQPACDATDAVGSPGGSALFATQAGSHPFCDFTSFSVDTTHYDSLKDVRVDLPAGLSVNPQAIPQCNVVGSGLSACPSDTAVGTASVTVTNIPLLGTQSASGTVYNMVPPSGSPGELSFTVTIAGLITVRTDMVAGVRSYPSNGQPGDYGEYVTISNINNLLGSKMQSTQLVLWGAPEEQNGGGAPDNAFLTTTTACGGPQTTNISADTYTSGQSGTASYTAPVGATGCASVPFNPTIAVTPSTTQRDAPGGFAIDLHVPQDQNPAHTATSAVQNASVSLPPGVSINPSAAGGLQACTDAQFGAGTSNPVACPSASAVGTVEIDTPALAAPLTGSIYVGQPQPGNPYRIFVDAENSAVGVSVRLVGSVSADPGTGQLTTTFTNQPQVAFTDFKLNFTGGPTALFANPLGCGAATTTTSITPYSGNRPATPSSSFTVDNDGSGGACPSPLPFAPHASAGLSTSVAAASPSLTLNVSRSDSDQTLSTVDSVLPPGLLANVSSVPLCPDAQANAGTCPSSSQVGTATVTSGAGSNPLTLSGTVYLTGPYNGAPFGLSIVVPAIAGPYNLGTVVTRAAVGLDTVRGQLSVSTDPLPTILQGIPLRIRSVTVTLNRAGMLVNPSSCGSGTAIAGTITSTGSASAPFSSPVQITGCASVPFAPTLTVTPSTTMMDAPLGLTVDVHLPQPGSADLQQAVMTLPPGVSIDPSAGNGLQACTDGQFGAGTSNPITCPSASAVGTVEIDTPLLSSPLTGSVYIGQPQPGNPYRIFVDAENAGYGLSVRLIGSLWADPGTGQLTATFANVPPIPVTDFKLSFAGGPGAVLASPETCGSATTTSALTPTTGATPATPSSSYTVDLDGKGGTCPSTEPFTPSSSVSAGSTAAGGPDPLTVDIVGGDQQQKLGSVAMTLPPGLLARVSAITPCAEPAASAGTCTSSSQIGTVTVSSGVGSSPLVLSGPVYLTRPYKGDPFGLSIVVPAVAGPYNLGTVVTRAAITIDPHDAHLTISSDTLPSILQGIPLRIKEVKLAIGGGFMLNPTSCQPFSVAESVTSVNGTARSLSSPFAATGCGGLSFAPSVSAAVTTSGAPSSPVGLSVTVAQSAGQANLQSVTMALPSGLAPNGAALNGACPESVYDTSPSGCPASSRVGSAQAVSSILPDPLTGSVYLVSHSSGLPTLEVALSADGVSEDLSGTIAIGSGGLTTTFAQIPDVPISSFTLSLPQGPSAVLGAGASLCISPQTITSTFAAHSGATATGTTNLTVTGCPSGAGGGQGGASGSSGAGGSAGGGSSAAGGHRGNGAHRSAPWPQIAIVRVRELRNHDQLRVRLRLPASGRVALSARQIAFVKATSPGRSRYVWVRLKLSRAGLRAIRDHRRLSVRVRIFYQMRVWQRVRVREHVRSGRRGHRTRTRWVIRWVSRWGRRGWVYKVVTFVQPARTHRAPRAKARPRH